MARYPVMDLGKSKEILLILACVLLLFMFSFEVVFPAYNMDHHVWMDNVQRSASDEDQLQSLDGSSKTAEAIRIFTGNLTGVPSVGNQMLQISVSSGSPSFSRHLMCRDHDRYFNPIEPTTVFRPTDAKAECLTTVSINNTIEFRWYYRSESSEAWISCFNYSMDAWFPGEYHYAGHLNIAGHGLYAPRAYKVDVYLDEAQAFSEFFELTNGGMNSPRLCEDIDVKGEPINMKSRFTIGVDAKLHHLLSFSRIAYFNEELGYCHNYTTVWMQPNGSVYRIYTSSFTDYKDSDITLNYWKFGWTGNDFIFLEPGTPVGDWRVEVYLDRYYINGTWKSYGPVVSTSFIIGDEPVADWTFMAYLDGDNSLESPIIDIFLKMANVGSSPRLNLVAQIDRIEGEDDRHGNWTDCRRFNISQGMTPTPDNATLVLGEVSMGDPEVLRSFIEWTMANYPATYYALALSDHGIGAMGLCFDETDSLDFLSLPELGHALSGLPAFLDVLILDACSMGMIEIADEIKDFANVMIAPEGIGYSPAPYDEYVSVLKGNPLTTPRDFSIDVVTEYIQWCNSIDMIQNATMTAADLMKMTELSASIDDFAVKLKEKETPHHELIDTCRNLTIEYQGPYTAQMGHYIDLYNFADLLQSSVADEELQNMASQLKTELSPGRTTIFEANKARPESHALSIFFPNMLQKYSDFETRYGETAFAEANRWDEFVKHHLSGHVLTVRTTSGEIPISVNEEPYSTNEQGLIPIFLLTGYHTLNVTAILPTGPGARAVFQKWSDGDESPLRIVHIDSDIMMLAEYETYFRLLIDTVSGTTNPSQGEHWYKVNSTIVLAATAPDNTPDERYIFLGWLGKGPGSYNGTANPTSVTMNAPTNETARWRHEYHLTVTSEYGSPTPASGWYEATKPVTVIVSSPILGLPGTRHVCTGWTAVGSAPAAGSNITTTFALDAPTNVTWNWKTQHLLTTVETSTGLNLQPHVSPPGPWYDHGTSVNITAQTTSGYTFSHWMINEKNESGSLMPKTIVMDKPYEIEALYAPVVSMWDNVLRSGVIPIIAGGAGIAVAAVALGIVMTKKRRERPAIEKPTPLKPPHIGAEEILPNRVATGYPDLDSLLYGGIPNKFAVILTAPSCDERDLLVKRFLETGIRKGDVTFYVTADPGQTGSLAQEYRESLYLFVCNPRADKIVPTLPNIFKLKGVENLTEISIALTKAIGSLDKKTGNQRRICLEIVSDVLLQHQAVKTRRWLADILTELESQGFTTLAVMNPKMHPPEEVHAIIDIFEGEISIYEKEREEKLLKITKMHNQKYIECELPLVKERLEDNK